MSFEEKFDPRRAGKITGSQVHLLFTKRDNKASQLTYAKHLANELFFGEIKSPETWQMAHGNDGERLAHNYFTEFFDFNVQEKPAFFEKGIFGGTPDAISTTYGIDYKCPTSLEKWLDYLHDGISHQQYHQCQMYMWLTGLKLWKICAFLVETTYMENDNKSYDIPYDKRMILINVEFDENWSDELEEKAKFIIEQRDIYFENLKNQFL